MQAKSSDLPIHFFTIVLNGQPFIQYHIDVFRALNCQWHWHIVEGVAELKHDTAWSVQSGGRIDDSLHAAGRSKDGTSDYLDRLAQEFPENITIYRKPAGVFWDGKREMVNAPLPNIDQECLLWQIDVDEFWTVEQIEQARTLFLESSHKTAAYYWCWYFVGENLIVSSRNCYSQNPQQEWLRTWRYQPGMYWAKHEPPKLVERLANAEEQDVAKVNPFLHAETEKFDLIFQHLAYVTAEQLLFKEHYYGYQNALTQWQKLQSERRFPVFLSQYFDWVKDDTVVERATDCGVVAIAHRQPETEQWQFRTSAQLQQLATPPVTVTPKILVDGVFFQVLQSGIGRVWRSLLEEWVENGFARHILVLDRMRTAPKIPGIRYRLTHPYEERRSGEDSQLLQQICDQEGIDLFISTYYTAPTTTPSAIMIYDMIPEVMNADSTANAWREKHYGIRYASAFITISHNTARDLVKFFPRILPESVQVAHCAVSSTFKPATSDQIEKFLINNNIKNPYFMVVGDRFGFNGYKNVKSFFQAFSQLEDEIIDIVCIGGRPKLEAELAELVTGKTVHLLRLPDEELAIAYSGAIALVYPSLYEGFGMPVLEAMSSGCPVITCRNSSLPEVAGEAAFYVNADRLEEFVTALQKVQDPLIRESLIAQGLKQAANFSWTKMADIVAHVLLKTAEKVKVQQNEKLSEVWIELRKLQADLQKIKYPYVVSPSLDMVEMQLPILMDKITAMESSKFWQLRSFVLLLKKLLGRAGEEDVINVDPEQPTEIQFLQAKAKIDWMQTSKFWKLRSSWMAKKKKLGLPVDE